MGESAQKNDAIVKMINPRLNIFFRPTISANRPKGAKKTAADNKNEVATQLKITASAENSFPIEGNAIFVADPIKGVTKEAKDVTTNVALSNDLSDVAFIFYALFLLSIVMVTGPSFSRATFINAPNTPVFISLPKSLPNCSTKVLYNGIDISGLAACW